MPKILQVWVFKTDFFHMSTNKSSLIFVGSHFLCCVINSSVFNGLKVYHPTTARDNPGSPCRVALQSHSSGAQTAPWGNLCFLFVSQWKLHPAPWTSGQKSKQKFLIPTMKIHLQFYSWEGDSWKQQLYRLWLVSAVHHHFINSLSSTFVSLFCQNCTNSTLLSMKEEEYPWQGAHFWCWFLVLEPPSSDCALGWP